MNAADFEVSRADGRSAADVLVALVGERQPGDVITFEELTAALSEGARPHDRSDARGAVHRSRGRILRECARALVNVRNVGYRIAPASDHKAIARMKKRKADKQLKDGLETLRHVKWEEMDEAARTAHEGTLMVVGALYENQRAMERRLSAIEDAIQSIGKRKPEVIDQ